MVANLVCNNPVFFQ